MASPSRLDEPPHPVRRGSRRSLTPTLTVVVASSCDLGQLHVCLASLVAQCQRTGAELVIVRACPSHEVASLAKAYPSARVVAGSPDASVADLRATGMKHAQGDIVAFAEDRGVPADDWIDGLFPAAHRDVATADGAGPNAIDWAAYFAERGFLPPERHAHTPEQSRND